MAADSQSSAYADLRAIAREIFLETLSRLEIKAVMQRKLKMDGTRLIIEGGGFELKDFRHIALVAIGKAAVPMAEGLLEILGPLLGVHRLDGVVVGPNAPTRSDPRLRYFHGSHPLPSAASQQAADAVLELLARCNKNSLVFFLISGGASAMVERPLSPAISIEEVAEFYQTLVHSGLNIAQMNTLRKHLSAVKGGRLAVAAGNATKCTLLVSDVPPGMPDVVGSGGPLPDSSTVEDCRELLRAKLNDAPVPRAIRDWFESSDCPETPRQDHPAFRKASWHMLLSSDDLCATARDVAISRGFDTSIDLSCDEWDYRDAAECLLGRFREMRQNSSGPVCLVSGGELSVKITGTPGRGGRNHQFALECARQLAQTPEHVAVLSAGSDGIDGNTHSAGAVADNSTVMRATEQGLETGKALAHFNAYPLLHALGDTIEIGPTGNNLRDLRLLLCVPGS